MADEAVVGEDAAQVRMAFEDDAEQVEGFALEPVRDRVQIHQRRHHRQAIVERRSSAARRRRLLLHRQQVRDDGETRSARVPSPLGRSSQLKRPGPRPSTPRRETFGATRRWCPTRRRRSRGSRRRTRPSAARNRTRLVAQRAQRLRASASGGTSSVTLRRAASARSRRRARSPKRALQAFDEGSAHAMRARRIARCVALLSARWCWCGGSSSAAAGCRRPALRRSAGSPARRCPPARCDRNRARRRRNSGSSRRRWRSCPSR